MTTIIPKLLRCPACETVFGVAECASTTMIVDEEHDRAQREMIEELTRNKCPKCARRATPDEVRDAPTL